METFCWTGLKDWPRGSRRRRAGLSGTSFNPPSPPCPVSRIATLAPIESPEDDWTSINMEIFCISICLFHSFSSLSLPCRDHNAFGRVLFFHPTCSLTRIGRLVRSLARSQQWVNDPLRQLEASQFNSLFWQQRNDVSRGKLKPGFDFQYPDFCRLGSSHVPL